MECYYVDEVKEIIDEEIQFHEKALQSRSGFVADSLQYTISMLKRLKKRIESLEVKDFNYQE